MGLVRVESGALVKSASDEAWLARLHLRKLLGHHPLDDAEVCEIACRRDIVFSRHLPELNPVIGCVEGLAGLVIHEGDDLVAHLVVVVRVFALPHVTSGW